MRGSTFLDVLLASFVLALGAAAFYSSFPTIDRSQRIAKDETVAAQIAQRMVEHLQLLKPSEVNAEVLTKLLLIDEGQNEQPFSFTSIPMDHGSCYSPAQLLRNGKGTLEIDSIPPGPNGVVPSKRVKVTITWTSPSGKSRSFVTGTILGGYK